MMASAIIGEPGAKTPGHLFTNDTGGIDMNKTSIERFNSKVDRSAPNGCHEWTASTNQAGYGRIRVKDKLIQAHRFAYEYAHGTIPEGKLVLHSCDNPLCCNPDHLRVGTHKDNNLDCVSRGRHTDSKLTVAEVIVIRAYTWISTGKMADILGVNQSTVSRARNRTTWGHI